MVNFDPESVESLSASQKRRILLEGREIFLIFAVIIFLLGLMIVLGGEAKWGMWFVILALIILFASFSRILFMRPSKQQEFITNRLLEKAIRRAERETGEIISEAERDRLRFQYDPAFHATVEKRAAKHVNRAHQAKIDQLSSGLQVLEDLRATELSQLESLRWQQASSKSLTYSLQDGKVCLNENLIREFSDLDHARLIIKSGTHESRRLSRVGVQKHLGATINKAQDKVDYVVSKRLHDPNVEEILPELEIESTLSTLPPIIATYKTPTCDYLAVRIYFKDQTATEIILLPASTKWHKKRCQNAYRIAWQILKEIEILSQTPLPEKVTPSEETPKIRTLDQQISDLKRKLEKLKNTPPIFKIPERYCTNSTGDNDYIGTIDPKADHPQDENNLIDPIEVDEKTNQEQKSPSKAASDSKSSKTKHDDTFSIPELIPKEEKDEQISALDIDCPKPKKDVK